MALGGGTFLVQNKVLPGSYINFVSLARASATLSDRGYGALALELDWGPDGEVFTVENSDFEKESQAIFGYDYTSDKLKGLRDLFKNLKTGYFFKINNGAVKAANEFATAKYGGIRGNDIKIVIAVNIDDESKFDVSTLLDNTVIDLQTVAVAADLIANDYVIFKSDATLAATAGIPLTGGTNGVTITGAQYQMFLDKIEAFKFNTLGCLSTEKTIKDLYIQFTKRMRDEVGAKFQTVIHGYEGADYEGIIAIKNNTLDDGWPVSSAVYFLLGAEAGCAVNRSVTNKTYDGDFTIDVDYKQSALENAMKTGQLMFHKVGEEVHVLDDINSFTSVTVDKNIDFNSNQTMRVLDQIGNDVAVLFNTQYLGKVQNNNAGRISFWKDLVFYHQELEGIQAIEDFVPDDVVVEKGNDKKSVVVTNPVTPVNCMTKLYMTVIVK
ncbi:phage tail sheath family protein [Sporomusa acidovorans]|uniref:Phage tail sheath protein n=1 Tax=Sporomusa acidovorans (strain ATCC 49682 / DSM 3132 / Mol) TaxID=1123286 RepID=A0ABZ3J6C8_SPOA4|nr:phage tail sheath family protein [Sporomusa acidovorans]OZC23813.1 phage tail sheath protein [Sporomusa acidovorans DSM 3132]SDF61895.1 Phage tail sheath protein [Sporomusa acidovorans]